MLSIKYIGNSEFELLFDSKKKIILSSDEISEIVEQSQDALYGKGENEHARILHEQRTQQSLHKD